MTESRLEYLFKGYLHNTCTEQEEEELMVFLAQTGNEETVKKWINDVIQSTGSEMQMPQSVAASILQNIFKKNKRDEVSLRRRKPVFKLWLRVAAASILFLAGASVYWMLFKKSDYPAKTAALNEVNQPIVPGGSRAVLTRSDGSTILLDSIANGTIIQKGSTKISQQGGLLIYNVSASPNPDTAVVYNILSTPRGGQYQVVLPDGSKVWLNAASSLHFPSAFPGNRRAVELTGEAYFEVTKNKEKPFVVNVGEMKVKVLGTHFNVNAYADESSIKTSLLEGSVNITRGSETGMLKPGEQAILNNKENKFKITNVNMEEVTAWRNGVFEFDGADITAIMREIGRWYNVEIVYDGKIPTRQFQGKISRKARLSDVLQILELSNVKCTVIGNKIIVQ